MAGWFEEGIIPQSRRAHLKADTSGLQAQMDAISSLNTVMQRNAVADRKAEDARVQRIKNKEAIEFSKMSDADRKTRIELKIKKRNEARKKRNDNFLHKINLFASDDDRVEGYENLPSFAETSAKDYQVTHPDAGIYELGIGADTATLQGIDKYALQKKQYDITRENIEQQGLFRTAQANATATQNDKIIKHNKSMEKIALAKEKREKAALEAKAAKEGVVFKKTNLALDEAAYQNEVNKMYQQYTPIDALPTTYTVKGSTTYTPIKGTEDKFNQALDRKYKEYMSKPGYKETNSKAITDELITKYAPELKGKDIKDKGIMPDLVAGFRKRNPGTQLTDKAIEANFASQGNRIANVWKEQATKELQSNKTFFTAKTIPDKTERKKINDFMPGFKTDVIAQFKERYPGKTMKDPKFAAAVNKVVKERKKLFLENTTKENSEALKLATQKYEYKLEQEKIAKDIAVAAQNYKAKVKVANIKAASDKKK